MAATPTLDAAEQYETDAVYQCPECEGDLSSDYGYWTCQDCAYVPYHPAD